MVAFDEDGRAAVYDAIYGRRDIRRFRDEPIPDDVLARVLDAAHHAPSVGFSQPWDLVVIRNEGTKRAVGEIADRAIAAAQAAYEDPDRTAFSRLKLEGIRESPVNICVTCDPTRDAPHVLGRNSMRRTDVYSTCLAIQNLWLAARAEGVGVGWVSFLYPYELGGLLDIPPHVRPIAYLCLGYPEDGFPDEPILQREGWRDRIELDSLVHEERWESAQTEDRSIDDRESRQREAP